MDTNDIIWAVGVAEDALAERLDEIIPSETTQEEIDSAQEAYDRVVRILDALKRGE